ncbi:MAG: exo-alpha-sialidase [Chloroflexi bacterium]|nr:exo-alpha-sialidase [Chloroflexota bacterium]
MHNVNVYRVAGRYAGWPANYGIWSWGDEIVVGFTVGYHADDGGFHARDTGRSFITMQARSLDGGDNWEVGEAPLLAPGNGGISAEEHLRATQTPLSQRANAPAPHPGGIDFTRPDFAMMFARTGLTAGAESWFYTSDDRCRSWDGPFSLPMFGQLGIAARTDYLVEGPVAHGSGDPHSCMMFLTATRPDGEEGRVFCAETDDGGRSFNFISWLRPDPPGFDIMPASVRVISPEGGAGIVTAIRSRNAAGDRDWIDLMRSDDAGRSWRYLSTPAPDTGTGGNPPAMIRLSDGRLCLTYGYRDAPSGIRAVLSTDDGETWGQEIVLRADGGNHDIGYPRSVQRRDGQVVTVYYFNDSPEGERYIAATIWKP